MVSNLKANSKFTQLNCMLLQLISNLKKDTLNYMNFRNLTLNLLSTLLFLFSGLLSCSVPLQLKAEILQTLSALALSKETAIPLWDNLEASQIIRTISSNMAYGKTN